MGNMTFPSHNLPPPTQFPVVLIKAKDVYKIWHDNIVHLKRVDRYSLGLEIDEVFRSLLELLFRASFANDKFEKLALVSQAIGKADLVKFFLQIAWEHDVIDNKKYSQLSLPLDEIGRMLGGWKKALENKTPPK